MIKYIKNYFFEFICYFFKDYSKLLYGFFYDLDPLNNYINIYNLYAFSLLKIFFLLYNVEQIKLEHEKNFIVKRNEKI